MTVGRILIKIYIFISLSWAFLKTGKKLGSHTGSKWWPDVKDDQNDPLTRWPNDPVPCLVRNMYWLLYILDLRFVLFLCTTAVWQFAINEYVMLCYLSNHISDLHQFLCVLHMVVARSSSGGVICFVLTVLGMASYLLIAKVAHRPAEAQCTRSLGLGYKMCAVIGYQLQANGRTGLLFGRFK